MEMAVVNLFGNLTMFLAIEMLFAGNNYRAINVLSKDRHDNGELSNEIMKIASNALKPTSHFVNGVRNTGRIKCEEPILNVVLPNYLNNETNVDVVRANIFPDDVTLLVADPSFNNTGGMHIKMWLNLSTKVILLTKNQLTIFIDSFGSEDILKINLLNFDRESSQMDNVFPTKFISRHRRDFSIFFQYLPSRSGIGAVDGNLTLIGPDGSLAEIMMKSLGVQPIMCSDLTFSNPQYEEWAEPGTEISSRMHYQSFYSNVMTTNILKVFNKRVTDAIDLHLSPYIYGEDLRLKTESLYPHEKDCMVIMVPKQSITNHFLHKIARDPDIQSVILALLLFTIARIIMEKANWKQWISIFIKSLGLFLNQFKVQNETSVREAWDLNLRVFSVLATITMSVIIYKNLMNTEYVEINTVEDLIASNLTIVASDLLQNDLSFWSNLKPILHDRIAFKTTADINFDIIRERKFQNAYILTDYAAEYMDMVLHSFISDEMSYKPTVRIMSEKLYCRLSSYRISRTSPLKQYVNDFVRRFVENGLYDKHLEWIRQLAHDIFQANKHDETTNEPAILDIDLVFGVFLLYFVGMAIALVVFVLELKVCNIRIYP